jgi:hypothetical protein
MVRRRVGRVAWAVELLRLRTIADWRIGIITLSVIAATGCNVNRALEQLSEARRFSSDLLVQFTKAADAANRAVMADTDAASVEFAREAELAKQKVQKDIDALGPVLQGLKFADESRLLQQFVGRFAEYSALDRHILDLAVENTNLKAQRLSFGPAQDAANSFRDALETVIAAVPAKDTWRAKALAATAVASVREIQVLQAPHIADPDDSAMTRLEQRMASSEAAARSALATLATLVQPASPPRLADATGALDRFMTVNAQIIALSRRNTNVRSLALSLNQKRPLIAACEETLHALQDALAKHGYHAGRWEWARPVDRRKRAERPRVSQRMDDTWLPSRLSSSDTLRIGPGAISCECQTARVKGAR